MAEAREEVLYIGFNQDHSFMTLGTQRGFGIYRLSPLQLVHREDSGNFRIVEMYSNSQLLALVGAGEQPAFSPRCLTMWNTSDRSAICDIYFNDSILQVAMNRIRIVAATSECVYIYDTSTMKKQHDIRTARNPQGLMALSPDHTACFLLYLSSAELGNFVVYDCFTMQMRRDIEAHKSPLAGLAINSQGTMSATVSTKGTIVRVFSLPEGSKLFTFKRGMSTMTTYQLFFSPYSNHVCLCGSSGSMHFFQLSADAPACTWSDSLSSLATYVVPEYYKDSFSKPRAVCVLHPPFSLPFRAALPPSRREVLLVSLSGDYCVYQFDRELAAGASILAQGNVLRMPLAMIRTARSRE